MAAHFLSPKFLRLLASFSLMGISVLVLQNALLEAPSPREPAAVAVGSQTPGANSAPAVAAISPRAGGEPRQAGIPSLGDGLWGHDAGVRPTPLFAPDNDLLGPNSAERAPKA